MGDAIIRFVIHIHNQTTGHLGDGCLHCLRQPQLLGTRGAALDIQPQQIACAGIQPGQVERVVILHVKGYQVVIAVIVLLHEGVGDVSLLIDARDDGAGFLRLEYHPVRALLALDAGGYLAHRQGVFIERYLVLDLGHLVLINELVMCIVFAGGGQHSRHGNLLLGQLLRLGIGVAQHRRRGQQHG